MRGVLSLSRAIKCTSNLCVSGRLHYRNTVTFQMSDFCRLRKEKEWHSPQFSIQDKARVRLAVDPSGVGRGQGSHVSMSLILTEVVQKEEEMYLEYNVSVAAIGQNTSATPKTLELCTVRLTDNTKRVGRLLCSAHFPLPSPGEVL